MQFFEISFFENFKLEDTSLANDQKKKKNVNVLRQMRTYNSTTYGKRN